jgi:predicted transcriptional regulator
MAKRGKLEIIQNILKIIQENHSSIKMTPLLRKSNLSSQRFSEYLEEILTKELVKETYDKKGKKYIIITDKGYRYLEKFNIIVDFIDEFDL